MVTNGINCISGEFSVRKEWMQNPRKYIIFFLPQAEKHWTRKLKRRVERKMKESFRTIYTKIWEKYVFIRNTDGLGLLGGGV